MMIGMRCLAYALLVAMTTPAFADGGTITGTILFDGEPPARDPVDRKSDKFCAKSGEHLSEDVVVANHHVRDVLVRIQNGTTGEHVAPKQPAVIDQRDCAYAPHVVGTMEGQQITVRNSDNTFHNVHGTVGRKLVFNKPQSAKADDLRLDTFAKAGDVLELTCDVHAWMHAWVVVNDSPYFAVTGDDGAFTNLRPARRHVHARGLAPGARDEVDHREDRGRCQGERPRHADLQAVISVG